MLWYSKINKTRTNQWFNYVTPYDSQRKRQGSRGRCRMNRDLVDQLCTELNSLTEAIVTYNESDQADGDLEFYLEKRRGELLTQATQVIFGDNVEILFTEKVLND
jgi:hypothetical protein